MAYLLYTLAKQLTAPLLYNTTSYHFLAFK